MVKTNLREAITIINGIESFRSYAKRRLAKFKGVPKHTFHLHLKEYEFTFNHREENLYDKILSAERKSSLKLSRPFDNFPGQ